MKPVYPIVALLGVATLAASGCTTREVASGAAGAAAAGGAYEYQHKQALEELKEDYEEGRISREEYERRKEAIEDRSVIY